MALLPLAEAEAGVEYVAPDTFDDDLEWIIEKLTERSGGSFGVLVRFIGGDLIPVVMARSTVDLMLDDAACATLVDTLRSCEARRNDVTHELLLQKTVRLGEDRPAVRLLYMCFDPAPGVTIVAAVCRPQASFTLLHELAAKRLHPVLARYIRLWWMHRTERRRASAFRSALNVSELGIMLMDRRGNVIFANNRLNQLLAQGDGLRRVGSSVSPVFPEDMSRFQSALQLAILGNLGGAGGAMPAVRPAPMLTLRQKGKRRALIVTVVGVSRAAIDPGDAAAILYVLDPEQDVLKLLAPVYRLYRLTPAESRLVAQLVSGASLAVAAAQMHVSLQTARAYLKQVFCKTSTNRQAELLRVMLASVTRTTVETDLSWM